MMVKIVDNRFKTKFAEFDAVQFVIDEIIPGKKNGNPDEVIGHFVLMKDRQAAHPLPKIRLNKGDSSLLNGIKIKTRFKVKY